MAKFHYQLKKGLSLQKAMINASAENAVIAIEKAHRFVWFNLWAVTTCPAMALVTATLQKIRKFPRP